ncbi:beta-ketoacyl synthase N-terminal-like domain-containing protein [Psychroserpens jangbogonensis]|uniref:beta-ketoacyl synthase N-terminal-like domain-containing protein n=1 Tax=Psychroserpens jangbogonensis TaxID=1484460 RepID=UPI00053E0306|nr:beta-ketoacyl synthase N-terminal-like domain-containing protein [Psychroserpens jangbogonensis]
MHKIYLSHNAIISSLGFDSETVVENIKNEISGISRIEDEDLFQKPFYGSIINKTILKHKFNALKTKEDHTVLEQLMILSLNKVIKASNITINTSVGLIISTTKGNIDVLEKNSDFPKSYTYLSRLGTVLKKHFSFKTEPIVVSNACVSGVLAISIAKRLIKESVHKHVFIVSGDLVSKFVLSGFNSFQALSDSECKPYSKDRTGINLGEAIASVLVTSDTNYLTEESVELIGDATCNDANHISGPSRSGEGLFRCVNSAMKEAAIKPQDIDYLSAHGTATIFNDDMEAIAFNRLGLQNVPLNSLKGYFGHTLGSSGLVETIVGMHSLKLNTLFYSKGFTSLGVSKPLHIIEKTKQQPLAIFLKTASGFGGANTALLLKSITYKNVKKRT